MPTRLWFIRHGEVEAPYVGTFLGRTDVGLSDVGKHQAQAVASFLEDAELDAIVTSPRARAQATAAPLVSATGMRPDVRDPFSEMDFGAWETLSWPQIAARDESFAAKWQEDPTDLPCPDGESVRQFQERVQEGLGALLEEFDGRTVALFGHAGTNRAVLAHLLDRPYMEMFRFAQDYGCINAGAVQEGYGQVALVNLVPGPRSEAHGDGGRAIE